MQSRFTTGFILREPAKARKSECASWALAQSRGLTSRAKAARLTRCDIPTWYALILLEAFTWLREQFRFYPVEVLHPPSREDADLAWIASREDADRDIRRTLMGLRPAHDALSRELKYDDGKANWTLSRVDTLAGDPERLPELSFEGTGGVVGGRQAFTFATSEAVVPGQTFYLRPRRDSEIRTRNSPAPWKHRGGPHEYRTPKSDR